MHCLPPLFVMESHPAMYMKVWEGVGGVGVWVGGGGGERNKIHHYMHHVDVIGVHIITYLLNSHHTC